MKHRRKTVKFSRSRAQRKALVKSLLRSILLYERIETTEQKAKAMRPWVDKVITWGKKGDLASRRLAYTLLDDHQLVQRLFKDIAPRFSGINGGYTRIFNVGYRKGDGARLSLLEFTKVERKVATPKKKLSEKAITKAETKSSEEIHISEKDSSRKGFMAGIRNLFKRDKSS